VKLVLDSAKRIRRIVASVSSIFGKPCKCLTNVGVLNEASNNE
jgi:hypothetical protein